MNEAEADAPKCLGAWVGKLNLMKSGLCTMGLQIEESHDRNHRFTGFSKLDCAPTMFEIMGKAQHDKTAPGTIDKISKNSNPVSTSSDTLNTSHEQPERFVDASTAASFCSIARRQLLMMARAGAIPAYPASLGSRRKQWRFRLSELAAAITKGLKEPERESTNRVDNGSRQSRSSRKGTS